MATVQYSLLPACDSAFSAFDFTPGIIVMQHMLLCPEYLGKLQFVCS